MVVGGVVRRQVFVAYSYRLYSGHEYRACFDKVSKNYPVDFVFADVLVTSDQVMEKISQMIRESTFSIFDISDWNPNVSLELGYARGIGHPYFILLDPSKSPGAIHDAPADLRGLDRIQYSSLETLEAGLTRLMDQLFARKGPLQESISEVIQEHVFAQLDRFISERQSSPDRDRTVAILPRELILPLDSEIRIEELPSYVDRFPADPFHPKGPVGPWITGPAGKVVGLILGGLIVIEFLGVVFFPAELLQMVGLLLVTAPIGAWYLVTLRRRISFERHTPYSITYHRPADRPIGPYFVWNFADPANPENPHTRAREGDPRAVRVELQSRPGGRVSRERL
jgi:hypothetical protein